MKCLTLALMFVMSTLPALAHEGHGEKPQPQPCVEVGLACARSATPAFGEGGRMWIVWSAGGVVRVSASTDHGASFAPPVAIPGEPAVIDDNGEARPKLVVLPDGTLVAAFGVRVDQHYSAVTLISRSSDGGRSFSVPVRMLGEVGQRFETLLAAPGGRLYAAWLDQRNHRAAKAAGKPYADTGVAVAWSDDGGATFAGKRILADYSCDCCRLAAALDRDGGPVYAWRHVYPGNLRDHAVAKLSADGSQLSPQRVSEDHWAIEACPMHGPSLAIGEDGVRHVAWYTGGTRRQGLFYAHSREDGAGYSEPQGFGDPARTPSRPQVLALGGRLWRAWKEFDGVATTVLVQLSGDDGETWDAARPLARTEDASDHPLLVADGATGYLSWLTKGEGYRLLPLPAGDNQKE